MKKIITFITALLICICINAQNQEQKGFKPRREFSPELYMKRLNEFVTREACLTETESAKFFPLLNEMYAKQHQLVRKQRELMMKGWKNKNLSESEYEKMVTKAAELDLESKKIEQSYYKKFHTVLSWKKVYAVRIALSRFQMEALNQFQPGRGNNNNNRGNFPHWNGQRKQ